MEGPSSVSIRPRFLVALGETRPVNDIARRHILTIISARYFHALDIPILEGRAFTDQDTASTSQVCIVNEEFVRRYLKGRDAIGTLVSVPSVDLRGPKPVVREIVGVIRQVKEQRGEKENAVEMYVPITQNPWYTASIVLQTAGNPKWFVSAVKAAIARVDKDQPVTRVRTMEEVAARSTSQPRFRAQLVAAFAAVASWTRRCVEWDSNVQAIVRAGSLWYLPKHSVLTIAPTTSSDAAPSAPESRFTPVLSERTGLASRSDRS